MSSLANEAYTGPCRADSLSTCKCSYNVKFIIH